MKLSVSTKNITPQNPEFFCGYSRKEKNKGIHDNITMNLIVIKNKGFKIFFYNVDLLNVSKKISEELTQKVNQMFSDEKNIVIFAATHTHSGPLVFSLPSTNTPINKELGDKLLRTAIEIAEEYKKNLVTIDHVLLEYGNVKGSYGNRNVKDGYADKSFFALKFIKDDKPIAAIVNLACHPTILKEDNLLFSADLFGEIRKNLSKKWKCPTLMFNGACGDVSSRFFTKESSFKELKKWGEKISYDINSPLGTKKISFEVKNSSIYCESTYYDAEEDAFWNEKKNVIATCNDLKTKEILNGHLENKFTNISKVTDLFSQQIIFEEFIIITFSGEIVAEFERKIRDSFDIPVIIICYEHDYMSYMVNDKDYGKYFESYVSRLGKGRADKFIEEIIAHIKVKLKK